MLQVKNFPKVDIAEARNVYETNFGKRIEWVYTGKTKSISLTGKECALKCAHCNKQWLKVMSFTRKIDDGTRSCLISGGCDAEGRVPLRENIGLIKELSKKARLLAHAGLVSEDDVNVIAPYIDSVSFNFVGDDDTIKEVLGIEKTVDDFVKSYTIIKKQVNVFPHITIGLHGGRIVGEYNALNLLEKIGTDMIVFNVFVPTPDTKYACRLPPKVDDVLNVIGYAREEFPDIPFALGCMRPGASYRKKLDEGVVGMVNRIVRPADMAVKKAKELGYKTEKFDECCVL